MTTTNQLMTAGAIAFAAFAVWHVTRKAPAGALANQPGQQQRDAGLAEFNFQQGLQWAETARHEVDRLASRYPAPTLANSY